MLLGLRQRPDLFSSLSVNTRTKYKRLLQSESVPVDYKQCHAALMRYADDLAYFVYGSSEIKFTTAGYRPSCDGKNVVKYGEAKENDEI